MPKLPQQMKHFAYRRLVRPAARFVMAGTIAFAVVYGLTMLKMLGFSTATQADIECLFIAVLLPGFAFGGLVVLGACMDRSSKKGCLQEMLPSPSTVKNPHPITLTNRALPALPTGKET